MLLCMDANSELNLTKISSLIQDATTVIVSSFVIVPLYCASAITVSTKR